MTTKRYTLRFVGETMMCSARITLICDVPKNVQTEITNDFKKAFEGIDIGWYGITNQIIMETLFTGKQLKQSKDRGVDINVPYNYDMFERLKRASKKHFGSIKIKGPDLSWCSSNFYDSFDRLSHLTDILFAARKLDRYGHVVKIQYKSG